MTYNAEGRRTSLENLAGQVTTTAWDGWSVTYNGENRPVLWQCVSTNSPTPNSSTHNSSTPTLISMSYDRMGRRVTKNNQRYVYDGYLQIANFELSTSNIKLQTFIWDPTEKIATRPLVWNSSTFQPFNFSTSYYVHDGNKNVSDVVADNGDIAAHYEYAPFGAVVAQRGASAAANPWRFSSEFAEDDTATVYYNYRHYEPVLGRWLRRDPMWENEKRKSIVVFCCNSIKLCDYRGLNSDCCCKVCLYSAVDLTTVHKRGPVDVGEGMHGHTWIMIESCSATDGEFGVSSANNTFSFGPEDMYDQIISGGGKDISQEQGGF